MNNHLHPTFREIVNGWLTQPTPIWPFPPLDHAAAIGSDEAIAKDNRTQAKAEQRDVIDNAPEALL